MKGALIIKNDIFFENMSNLGLTGANRYKPNADFSKPH
jgi:hypothetical protein